MRQLKRKLFTQYNLGMWVGGLRDILTRMMFYISMINFLLIIAMAYNTTIRDFMLPRFPWFNFPIFIFMMILFVFLAMLLEYKFIVPSSVTYANRQLYTHQNLLRRDLAKVSKELEEIKALLKEK